MDWKRVTVITVEFDEAREVEHFEESVSDRFGGEIEVRYTDHLTVDVEIKEETDADDVEAFIAEYHEEMFAK